MIEIEDLLSIEEDIKGLKDFRNKLRDKEAEFRKVGHLVSAGFYRNAIDSIEAIINSI